MSADHDRGEVARRDDAGMRSTRFGAVAQHDETFRSRTPADAIRWLFLETVDTVVDVGTGTGTLNSFATCGRSGPQR